MVALEEEVQRLNAKLDEHSEALQQMIQQQVVQTKELRQMEARTAAQNKTVTDALGQILAKLSPAEGGQ